MKTYLTLLAFVALGIPVTFADNIAKEEFLPITALELYPAGVVNESDERAQEYLPTIQPSNKTPHYVGGILVPNDPIAPVK